MLFYKRNVKLSTFYFKSLITVSCDLFWPITWQEILWQILTNRNCWKWLMLFSWGNHNLISLIVYSGYYKAAAMTTDKLLQEHQEINVSKPVVCLLYPLMAGIPFGYWPLIGIILVGNFGNQGGLFTLTVPLSTQLSFPVNCILGVTLRWIRE